MAILANLYTMYLENRYEFTAFFPVFSCIKVKISGMLQPGIYFLKECGFLIHKRLFVNYNALKQANITFP